MTEDQHQKGLEAVDVLQGLYDAFMKEAVAGVMAELSGMPRMAAVESWATRACSTLAPAVGGPAMLCALQTRTTFHSRPVLQHASQVLQSGGFIDYSRLAWLVFRDDLLEIVRELQREKV